jgi:hypothetical protein
MKLAARLERAFALLSVALTSNIGRTLEMMTAPASSESYPTTSSLWRICYGIGLIGVFAWACGNAFPCRSIQLSIPTFGDISRPLCAS